MHTVVNGCWEIPQCPQPIPQQTTVPEVFQEIAARAIWQECACKMRVVMLLEVYLRQKAVAKAKLLGTTSNLHKRS